MYLKKCTGCGEFHGCIGIESKKYYEKECISCDKEPYCIVRRRYFADVQELYIDRIIDCLCDNCIGNALS